MTIYGYRRVSSQGQTEGTSLADQTVKVQALAQLVGLAAPIMIEDVCSGSVPVQQRPGGKAMFDALKTGDTIIVSKLDRIFRDATDALTIADDLKQRGIDLYLIDMGTDPVTQNGVSRMFFGMLALMAEFERNRIRERLEEGRKGKRAKGGHIGGQRPFGFDVVGSGREATLVPHPGEQKVIERIKTMRNDGQSLRTIASTITNEGFAISHVTVGQVLKRI